MKSWNEQLLDMRDKYCPGQSWEDILNPKRPDIEDKLKFPVFMIYYRKKITSVRNPYYIVFLPIWTLSGLAGKERILKSRGFSKCVGMISTNKEQKEGSRWYYWGFRNWDDAKRIACKESDIKYIDTLKGMYPTPIVTLKDKKGQFKIML